MKEKGLLNRKIKLNSTGRISSKKVLTDRLFEAIRVANFDEAKDCIDKGAKITAEGKYTNPVILAAQYGRVDILKYALSTGVKADIKDMMGATPLMWASSSKNLKVVDILLEYGADINLPDAEFAATPLIWWVVNCDDNVDKIKYLVNRGANICYRDITGKSCVEYAEDNGYYDVAEYLRKEQNKLRTLQSKLYKVYDKLKRVCIKISKKSYNYENYIDYFSKCYEAVKEQISLGARIDDSTVDTLLFCAEYFNDTELETLCNKQIEYKRQRSMANTTQKAIKRKRAKLIEEIQ